MVLVQAPYERPFQFFFKEALPLTEKKALPRTKFQMRVTRDSRLVIRFLLFEISFYFKWLKKRKKEKSSQWELNCQLFW